MTLTGFATRVDAPLRLDMIVMVGLSTHGPGHLLSPQMI